MGVITEISFQKNKKRVNVFVDGEFVSGINFDFVIKNKLKVGQEIDENKLKMIVDESEMASAFDMAASFLSSSAKTKKEVFDKLEKKGFSHSVAERVLQKLEDYGYVDDKNYANLFVRSYPTKSKRGLKNKLLLKGVTADIVEEVLFCVSDDTEEEKARVFAEKYMKSKEPNEKNLKNLFAGIVRRGFSFSVASKIVNEFKQGE